MSRLKDKLATRSNSPVLATLVASFMEKQEKLVKALSSERNRTYTNILPASRNGVSIKQLQPIFDKALNEAIREASAIDLEETEDNYKEQSMKRYLLTYSYPA